MSRKESLKIQPQIPGDRTQPPWRLQYIWFYIHMRLNFCFSFPHRWKGIIFFFPFRVWFCKVAHHVRRVINQGWGRYSRKEKALTKHKLESRSRRRSREELQREQQANIFNPRDHAGRLIRTPPPLITGLFTRLHYMWRQYQLARLWKSNEIW